MTNFKLTEDYKKRARGRRKAILTLIEESLFADAVRECQEAAELGLKSMIREAGHAIPFTHEVSGKLREITSDLKPAIQGKLERLIEISKSLRRDRELAFCGSEDITPGEFYTAKDAQVALGMLDEVLELL